MDKCFVEAGIQDAEHGLVENPVAHAGLVDMPELRVPDKKGSVRVRTVGFGLKRSPDFKKVLFQGRVELLHVELGAFTALKLPPCGKQVFKRDYPLKNPSITPPPDQPIPPLSSIHLVLHVSNSTRWEKGSPSATDLGFLRKRSRRF